MIAISFLRRKIVTAQVVSRSKIAGFGMNPTVLASALIRIAFDWIRRKTILTRQIER